MHSKSSPDVLINGGGKEGRIKVRGGKGGNEHADRSIDRCVDRRIDRSMDIPFLSPVKVSKRKRPPHVLVGNVRVSSNHGINTVVNNAVPSVVATGVEFTDADLRLMEDLMLEDKEFGVEGKGRARDCGEHGEGKVEKLGEVRVKGKGRGGMGGIRILGLNNRVERGRVGMGGLWDMGGNGVGNNKNDRDKYGGLGRRTVSVMEGVRSGIFGGMGKW